MSFKLYKEIIDYSDSQLYSLLNRARNCTNYKSYNSTNLAYFWYVNQQVQALRQRFFFTVKKFLNGLIIIYNIDRFDCLIIWSQQQIKYY